MQAIITVGLGFGDEGKGSVVDFLCRKFNSKLVIRYNGGLQCAHTVVEPNGRKHTFHQFGSGTLAGASTYLDKNVIVSPYHIQVEANDLRKIGIEAPLSKLQVHPKALVSTFLHMLANKAAELCRYDKHGTCCAGIGATRKYWLDYGGDSITMEDCCYLQNQGKLEEKLHLLKQRLLTDFSTKIPDKVNSEHPIVDTLNELNRCNVAAIANRIHMDASNICLSYNPRYGNGNETVIFEGAQGVLLDQYYGFFPHTTWSTTTTEHALERVDHDNYMGAIYILGIVRAHMSRHGAGPMPTEDKNIKFTDENNPENIWQGKFRYGYLDIPMIDYAIKCNGGVNGLFVTHIDQELFKVCTQYYHPHVNLLQPVPNVEYQAQVTKLLPMVQPYYVETTTAIQELTKLAPILGTSTGKTHEDKTFYETILG